MAQHRKPPGRALRWAGHAAFGVALLISLIIIGFMGFILVTEIADLASL